MLSTNHSAFTATSYMYAYSQRSRRLACIHEGGGRTTVTAVNRKSVSGQLISGCCCGPVVMEVGDEGGYSVGLSAILPWSHAGFGVRLTGLIRRPLPPSEFPLRLSE